MRGYTTVPTLTETGCKTNDTRRHVTTYCDPQAPSAIARNSPINKSGKEKEKLNDGKFSHLVSSVTSTGKYWLRTGGKFVFKTHFVSISAELCIINGLSDSR